MKQIIVDVSDLSVKEKRRVNEALAKIKNIEFCNLNNWDEVVTMYAPSINGINVGFDYYINSSQTHTPQQILEMAGMVEKRGVHKDFDPVRKYNVDVSGCTEEEKKKVQQAFFDIGFLWFCDGKNYQHLHAASYTNTLASGQIMCNLMFGFTAKRCNMTAKEFLDLVYEPEKKGNIHAEKMALYAEDAKTCTEPWKLWQVKGDDGVWRDCLCNPMWAYDTEYRRKPKMHIVHGVEIPDLRFKPKNGQQYWTPAASIDALVWETIRVWESSIDTHRAANNLCYEPTEEGKQAAILHAKAWLGIA